MERFLSKGREVLRCAQDDMAALEPVAATL
jgi:hypothetical protein